MSVPREDRVVGTWPRAWGSYGQWTREDERNPYWSGRGSDSCQTHDEKEGNAGNITEGHPVFQGQSPTSFHA